MSNPFVFGRVVDEKNFCNRRAEIKELSRNIINGYSVWLFAPRRYGKSSLIKQVYKIIPGKIKTVYFDFYNIKSIDDFARKYSNVLAKELFNWKDDVKNLSQKLGKYLKSLQPQLSFDTTASPSILLNNKEIIEQSNIEEVLNLPEKLAIEQNIQICVAFDEFQEISRIDKFLINWMRSTFQNQKRVSYVFLGSKQSLMQDIFTNVNSPFYEYAKKMEIGKIENEELYNFISKKFNEAGLDICSTTINDILEYSNLHPHFTQYFASVVFDVIKDGEDENDVNFKINWMNKIINSQSVIFQNIFDQLNNNQRKIIIAIANLTEELYSENTKKEFGLPSSSTISTNIVSLMSKDLINKDKGKYIISNPVFAEWLKLLN